MPLHALSLAHRASFYLTHLQSHHAPPAGKAAAAHDAPHTHCSTAPPVHSSTAAKAAVNGDASINGKAAAALPAGLYRPYLLENIERDGSKAVGLGLPMWILVICFVLLSGDARPLIVVTQKQSDFLP